MMARWRRLVRGPAAAGARRRRVAVARCRPAFAQEQGQVPGETLGNTSDPDFWRAIRRGEPSGTRVGAQPAAGVLIQSEGDNWRAIRNGPLSTYGVWALIGIVALLALFFALRGGSGSSTAGRAHGHPLQLRRPLRPLADRDLLRGLALTGLNMLYGRYVLRPLIGPELFSMAHARRQVRAQLPRLRLHARPRADVRPVGRQNFPNRHDFVWLAKGGGMFKRGLHPPGQEVQRRAEAVVLAGGAGRHLGQPVGHHAAVPVRFEVFGETFGWINWLFGTDLPDRARGRCRRCSWRSSGTRSWGCS